MSKLVTLKRQNMDVWQAVSHLHILQTEIVSVK